MDGGQQFGLQMVGEIAYFIEKEGAAAGCFELAGTVGMGIGERAFYVAEQFAFERLSVTAPISTLTISCRLRGERE